MASSNLPSLLKRRLLASLCHLYKISKGLTDYDEAPLHAQIHIYNTRASCKQMFSLPQCRTNSYQHSYFPNAISIWNSLPKEVNLLNVPFNHLRTMHFHLYKRLCLCILGCTYLLALWLLVYPCISI